MPLYLVNPAVDMSLELYVSDSLEKAMTVQYERIKDRRARDTFVRHLEQRLETLLCDAIDWDLKPPTEAQLSYATLLAKQLSIELPPEVRTSRFHAAMFLEEHAAKAKLLMAAQAQGPSTI